ncbi:MAG: Uma2 family endonuclease [Leptolyngbyaceae bacterium]|nr:Uma2 family endonuclease [Leptolyngbyaceae bacterium]
MIAIPSGFSPEEYLALEQQNPIRHEYRHGQVYAMAGGSDDHDEICLNLIEILRRQVREQGCEVRSGNVKVNYAQSFYYYPDVFVTCDHRDRQDRYIKRYPQLIAEVLSPGTEAFDRSEKFQDYQQLSSLSEYLLISQTEMWVEYYHRQLSQSSWNQVIYRAGDCIQLSHLGLEVAIEELYRGVSWYSI